jgi:hypothetical protein
MELQKLNKQELIDLLNKQNQELEKLNAIDLKATIDLKNEAIKNEHELRKENKKLLDKIQLLIPDIEELKKIKEEQRTYIDLLEEKNQLSHDDLINSREELEKIKEEKENIILNYEEEKQNIILKYEEEIKILEQTLKFEKDNIQPIIDLKNQAIKNEHELRQENNNIKNKLKTVEDSNNHLIKKINELAEILEEYVTSFEEQQKIFAIVLKNNNYIQSALKQKIEIFNKGE